MVGRRLVRTCSCGKPYPCEEGRWNRLRTEIKRERAAMDEAAAGHGELGHSHLEDRAYGRVEECDYLLALMDRMEGE